MGEGGRIGAGSVYHVLCPFFGIGQAFERRSSSLWLQLGEDGRRQASTNEFEEDQRDAGEQRDSQCFPDERQRHQECSVEVPE